MKKKELAERVAAIEKHLGIDKHVELEIGKWYKRPKYGESIFFLKEITDSWLKGFGLNYHKKWTDNFQSSNHELETYLSATPEEVKSALVEEAKRRGHTPFYDFFNYNNSLNILYDRCGHDQEVIFNNGKWAEIIERPKSILDGKVAIQVSNEREFELLMKHYEEKGWRWQVTMQKPTSKEFKEIGICPINISYKNDFGYGANEDWGYTIIPFSEFATEVGIEVPVFIMKSEDGVDLYECDEFFEASNHDGDGVFLVYGNTYHISKNARVVLNPDNHKAFSTREAAEKWIEEQNKPKEFEFLIANSVTATVNKKGVSFDMGVGFISATDIDVIYKTIQQLKGGENGQN